MNDDAVIGVIAGGTAVVIGYIATTNGWPIPGAILYGVGMGFLWSALLGLRR